MSSKNSATVWQRLDVKLTVYFTTLFLVLLLMLCSFFYYRIGHNLLKQIDRILMDETFEFINVLNQNQENLERTCQLYEANNVHKKYYPIYFRVLHRGSAVYYASENIKTLKHSPFDSSIIPLLEFLNIGRSHNYRYSKKKFTLADGQEYTIQVAMDIDRINTTLQNLLENIVIVIPVLLILNIWWGLFLSRKYRTMVSGIVTITNRITSQNLRERLPVPAMSDEFQGLATTINSMIDRLEQSFKEVKQFTSDVSHELRTPLFGLKGEFEVALSQNRNDDAYREAISEALERVNALINMVNDLFLISRFDVNKMDMDMMYLNLAEAVKDLYDFYLPVAQDKNLQFQIQQCDDVVIRGDKTRIHQLLSNLLDNAVKFTPENGTITISVSAYQGAAQFQISDNGIGIAEAELPHIFNRFYQADKSRSGANRGTGLGLHICKRIAEAHGGNIQAVSNQEKGVTFILTIPTNM
jgi:heavy metal sensor kinase